MRRKRKGSRAQPAGPLAAQPVKPELTLGGRLIVFAFTLCFLCFLCFFLCFVTALTPVVGEVVVVVVVGVVGVVVVVGGVPGGVFGGLLDPWP